MILINPQPQSPVRPEYKKRECLLNQHQQSAIYSLLYNKLKTNTMSQWISIEAAAEKYRLEKEYIWLWVEMKKITVSYENDTVSRETNGIRMTSVLSILNYKHSTPPTLRVLSA